MKARVTVTLKTGILDPQGKAIEGALKSLGVARRRQRAPGQGVRHRDRGRRPGAGGSGTQGRGREAARQHGDRELSRRGAGMSWSHADPPAMKSAVVVFPASIASATWRARSGSCRAPSRPWSGTPTPRCRPAPIWWSFRAAFPTATICAAARSRRARRSWTRCAHMPARGGLVLGVCNGFQILCESGLLPGVLMRNAALQVHLQGRLSAGRALRHAVHARLQRRPGDPRAGRARRGQLRRRRRDHRAARGRGPGGVPLRRAGRQRSIRAGTSTARPTRSPAF